MYLPLTLCLCDPSPTVLPQALHNSAAIILARGGVGSHSDYNASLSSNWTELDWTGIEFGKTRVLHCVGFQIV